MADRRHYTSKFMVFNFTWPALLLLFSKYLLTILHPLCSNLKSILKLCLLPHRKIEPIRLKQCLLKCGLGISKTLSEDLRSQNYFHNNTKMWFAFLLCLLAVGKSAGNMIQLRAMASNCSSPYLFMGDLFQDPRRCLKWNSTKSYVQYAVFLHVHT